MTTQPARVPLAREVHQLRAKMTREEHVAKAEQMAAELKRYDDLVNTHKAEKSRMREREQAQAHEVRELATDVRLGSEVRDVSCRWVADFSRKCVDLIRLDTGEIVRSRTMSDADRQLAIHAKLEDDDLDPILIDPVNPTVPDSEDEDEQSNGDLPPEA